LEGRLAGGEYPPAEDTFFLADHISGERGTAALDIGSGSGYLTMLLCGNFSLVVGTDVDFCALSGQTYRTPNLVCCHGADALNCSFDLIVCNLPYLATDGISDVSTDGGRGGLEVPQRIIDTVPRCLSDTGRFLFVTSSLSDYGGLIRHCQRLGMSASVVAKKRLFFEELILIRAEKLPAQARPCRL